MVRAAAVLFCITVGLWIGYGLWGVPATGLREALERVAVENDQLRTRLSEASRDRHDPSIQLSASLESILHRLGEQAESIRAQTDAITTLGNRDVESRDVASQLNASLQECDATQTKIQEQLERCLFAKADLERAAAAAKKAAAGPRPGKQTYTETIELPHVPGVTDNPSSNPASAPRDSQAVKSSSSDPVKSGKSPSGP